MISPYDDNYTRNCNNVVLEKWKKEKADSNRN